MTNKIDGFNQLPPIVSGGNKSDAAGSTQSAAPLSKSRDTVTLTESAHQLQKLGEAIASVPVTNAARVQLVKDALGRDAFTVDAERVADKILKFERDLS